MQAPSLDAQALAQRPEPLTGPLALPGQHEAGPASLSTGPEAAESLEEPIREGDRLEGAPLPLTTACAVEVSRSRQRSCSISLRLSPA